MKVVIKIEDTTRERLKALGKKGETYDTVILRLLDKRPDPFAKYIVSAEEFDKDLDDPEIHPLRHCIKCGNLYDQLDAGVDVCPECAKQEADES